MTTDRPSAALVALVIPNSRWQGKKGWMILPHAALILTALLKDKFDFRILDANAADLSESDVGAWLREHRPRVVLVSALAVEYHSQYHAIPALARQNCPEAATVIGGVYPTVLGEEAIRDPNLDWIFIGHAEERVEEFLRLVLAGENERVRALPGIGYRDARGEPVINEVTSRIVNVKNLVRPDYSLLDVEAYVNQTSKDYQFNTRERSAPIISSYGCPYNCLFCATRTISGRGVVYRAVEEVLDEIDFLRTKFGVRHLVFIDDCLLGNRPRIETLLGAMIERGWGLTWKAASVSAWHLDEPLLKLMKASGCVQLTISVESGSPRVLNRVIRKPLKLPTVEPLVRICKEVGIDIGANFVIGFPGETWEEVRQTFAFAERCNFDLAHFHIATPLPKTDLYYLARDKGLLPPDFSFTDPKYLGFAQAFIATDEFTPFELMVLRAFEWDRINFSTPEKTAKAARMMNMTLEELAEHRRQTRRKLGVHVAKAD
jgi:anaerobic magnesium-protoporphyrin IX monomethyl ester cyclase